MLTGKMVRVRYARNRIVPCYLDVSSPEWLETAGRLLEVFRNQGNRRRGELEDEVRQTIGDDPGQLVHQGLAKLVEDRCEFEVVSGHPPEALRESVFQAAALDRRRRAEEREAVGGSRFERDAVVAQVAAELQIEPRLVEEGLFADLKSEQRVVRFRDTTPERLLERYNVALAQAVLLRSTKVSVAIRHEPPQRYRQLFRMLKFHRLICEVEASGPESYRLHLDGPLSLFAATQKYGLQLALFLPAVLLCKDFELKAELRWGPQRKPKTFSLTSREGLRSHLANTGTYVPAEMAMFVELFRKRIEQWEIAEEAEVFPLGNAFWVPDFRLTERATGRVVLLEVLGFWRRASAERHLGRLREHAKQPFLLAVSDSLRIDDAELEGLPAGVHRFRQMPLPDEVARLAVELLQASGGR